MTILQFLRETRLAVQYGWRFQLFSTPLKLKDRAGRGFGRGLVDAYGIWHLSPQGSLWSPDTVVLRRRQGSTEPICWTNMAAARLGLDRHDWRLLKAAQMETKEHDPGLRRDLLKACGVFEYPHRRRMSWPNPSV